MFKNFIFILFVLFSSSIIFAKDPTCKITFVKGKVEVVRNNKSIIGTLGQELLSGDKIKTFKGSRLEIKFFEGSVLRLNENTQMIIKELKQDKVNKENKTSLKTFVGNVWVKAKKTTGYKSSFEVGTPTAIAGVRSTVWRMNIGDDTTTMVRVYKGKVEVKTWLEAYESMIKSSGEEKEILKKERKEVEGPTEVEGPSEVTLEEWVRIVEEMQQVVIKPNQMPEEVSKFDVKEDEKDPWVIWNKERDKQIKEY